MNQNSPVIYILDMNENITGPQFDRIRSYLPKQRISKSEGYLREKDRNACLTSFFLLVYGLKQYGIYQLPEIATGEYGKPFFKDSSIRFNLSHCDRAVCCGLSFENIGVDIQDTVMNYEDILYPLMSEKEISLIRSHVQPCEAFTRLWCLKESLGKFNGTGISENMSETEILCREDNFSFRNRLFSLARYEDYQVCACTEKYSAVFIQKNISEYLDDIRYD